MPMPDEISMLTAIALFLWSASSEIIGVQSLQNGCMNRFKNALNSCDPWVSYTENKHGVNIPLYHENFRLILYNVLYIK